MATSVCERGSLGLDDNIAARAAALPEGREMPELEVRSPQTKRREFVSRPDAKPMKRADVCNVEKLAVEDARELLSHLEAHVAKRIREKVALDDLPWGGWPDNDVRWELTPHALRRLETKQRVSRHLKAV